MAAGSRRAVGLRPTTRWPAACAWRRRPRRKLSSIAPAAALTLSRRRLGASTWASATKTCSASGSAICTWPDWIIAYCVLADDEISAWTVPACSAVLFRPYVSQRLPVYWPRPGISNPERFIDNRIALRPCSAYFPVGGGPHLCIGNDFALMEAQVILEVHRYQRAESSASPVL